MRANGSAATLSSTPHSRIIKSVTRRCNRPLQPAIGAQHCSADSDATRRVCFPVVRVQEIGNRDKAKQCLKYVVVANMLSGGLSNPFDAREAKVYQNEADIAIIGTLRAAYEKCDVDAFGKALEDINNQGDKFIRQ